MLGVTPITEAADPMSTFIRQFLCNETGATAIEYGLIAAGISIAIITAVAGLGSSLNSTFTSVSTALK
jgi:pilus assembly protein Flp/PilA